MPLWPRLIFLPGRSEWQAFHLGTKHSPLFHSSEPPSNPTWTPTRTQRAAWLHVPTMRPHKNSQLSRTGRSLLKRLSMQLFHPAVIRIVGSAAWCLQWFSYRGNMKNVGILSRKRSFQNGQRQILHTGPFAIIILIRHSWPATVLYSLSEFKWLKEMLWLEFHQIQADLSTSSHPLQFPLHVLCWKYQWEPHSVAAATQDALAQASVPFKIWSVGGLGWHTLIL